MGWKKRPPCVICGKPSYVFMLDNCFCGECVIGWDKRMKDDIINKMKADYKK